jgi:electron transfer flavoprotein beta subunit
MNIAILVKQVPDTTEMKIDSVTGTLIRTGVPSIINPDDLAGLEAALQLKDQLGATLTVITMGPPQAEGMLREILARGVDEAVLLSDAKFAGADTWATSTTLAAYLRQHPADLILAGRQAIDGDTAQVGPQVAEKLGLPQVTYVEGILGLEGQTLRVLKAYEDVSEELEVDLPALITTLSTMNTPRLMNVRDAWIADEKPYRKVTFADLDLNENDVGLKGSPTQVRKTFTRTLPPAALKTDLSPDEAANLIVDLLGPYLEA